MSDIRIYTGRNCGWAIRNYAALIEKELDFDTVPALDRTGNKNAEFLTLTPYGMTPVLVHGDVAVFESILINDYLDDCFPAPPLMPPDAAGRIAAQKWIHFCEHRLLSGLTSIVTADNAGRRDAAATSFVADLAWFGKHVLEDDRPGPYFFGAQFSLLDIAFHTLFVTAREIASSYDERAAISHPAMWRWRSDIEARPSIREALRIQDSLPF